MRTEQRLYLALDQGDDRVGAAAIAIGLADAGGAVVQFQPGDHHALLAPAGARVPLRAIGLAYEHPGAAITYLGHNPY